MKLHEICFHNQVPSCCGRSWTICIYWHKAWQLASDFDHESQAHAVQDATKRKFAINHWFHSHKVKIDELDAKFSALNISSSIASWRDDVITRIKQFRLIFKYSKTLELQWTLRILQPREIQFSTKINVMEQCFFIDFDFFLFRILAFSTFPIVQVEVRINNGSWAKCNHIQGPLYVSKWKPKLYRTGIHYITVIAHFCMPIVPFVDHCDNNEDLSR